MASSAGLKPFFKKLTEAIFQRRFFFLFLALLLPYLVHPLIATEVVGIFVLDLAFSLVLIMGVFAVSDRKHLPVGRYRTQPVTNHTGRLAADPGIDLVEHQGPAGPGRTAITVGARRRQRQHHP